MGFLAELSQVLLLLVGLLMIMIVLLQRGRGGGLAGAFGGLGGQSAFGTRAGDVFTRITCVIAVIWVLLAGVSGWLLHQESLALSGSMPTQKGASVAPTGNETGTDLGAPGELPEGTPPASNPLLPDGSGAAPPPAEGTAPPPPGTTAPPAGSTPESATPPAAESSTAPPASTPPSSPTTPPPENSSPSPESAPPSSETSSTPTDNP